MSVDGLLRVHLVHVTLLTTQPAPCSGTDFVCLCSNADLQNKITTCLRQSCSSVSLTIRVCSSARALGSYGAERRPEAARVGLGQLTAGKGRRAQYARIERHTLPISILLGKSRPSPRPRPDADLPLPLLPSATQVQAGLLLPSLSFTWPFGPLALANIPDRPTLPVRPVPAADLP